MGAEVPDFETFRALWRDSPSGQRIPVMRRLASDALTPVLAYRRLAGPQAAGASFLFESVEGGERVGRYSYVGARPQRELIARGARLTRREADGTEQVTETEDPLGAVEEETRADAQVEVAGMPAFAGGWVGYAAYDAVRYWEPESLAHPPPDDRGLPDLHMQLHRELIAFDHVRKCVLVIAHATVGAETDAEAAWDATLARLGDLAEHIATSTGAAELTPGALDLAQPAPVLSESNMGAGGYQRCVERIKRYIEAGDAFQVVPSQRFTRSTNVAPLDLYRALRVVNPSPYMFFLHTEDAVLVGASPEILCRVHDGVITNRPLAGTRKRSADAEEDATLEEALRNDPKDRAEHAMLVDLGRNDVGRVAQPGTIALPALMSVERYSHVMHLSSTITARLAPGRTCWDALRATLPVGTVSGAPKIRAMQIIDELEPVRRGPYGGAVGFADFGGNMDMAIALRTMVVQPTGQDAEGAWRVHLQAGGGIVADSDPEAEHQETVNKAAALAKAIAVAEEAFGRNSEC